MTELPPGLREFGERLKQAAEREIAQRREGRRADAVRPRRGRLRSLALPVTAALVAAAVSAGAAGIVTRDGPPIAPDSPGSAGHETARDPTVVLGSAAKDPAGGPAWVVRAYTDERDHVCVQLGRLRGGVFGVVRQGRFQALAELGAPTCSTDGPPRPVIAIDRHAGVGLTVVFGLAVDRSVVTVNVGKQVRHVRPAGFGAFVAIFSGAGMSEPITVRSMIAGRENTANVG